uniref:Orf32 n=1 Tax=Globisporangium ultimum TaxID=2052682 RepID=D8WJ99_GLOUL|nr:orf32 [Globisporangium ultimum]ACZ43881.1 orf32 [Globisporangium ultimum]ACZ44463.1 orf32 [Globisporangium ultimum]
MFFKIIGTLIIILLLFSDIKNIKNKIKQYFNK